MNTKTFFLTVLAVVVALVAYHMLRLYLPTLGKSGKKAITVAGSTTAATSSGDPLLDALNAGTAQPNTGIPA